MKIKYPVDENIPEIEIVNYRFLKMVNLVERIWFNLEDKIQFIRNLREHWIFLKRKYPLKDE